MAYMQGEDFAHLEDDLAFFSMFARPHSLPAKVLS